MKTIAAVSSLDTLLSKLQEGDDHAAAQHFRAYAPYLRMVVRRQLSAALRTQFDAVDIAQSVWADLLHGFRQAAWSFADAGQLRAFLIRATRNRFIDRFRRPHPAQAWQQPFADAERDGLAPCREPRPSDVAQADELWQQMQLLCPLAHRAW